MTTKTLSKSDLAQFTGSENWYRHGINRNVLYTDGAQHVAEHGGAYWLLDEIAIIQPYNKAVAAEEFQVWKLAVRPDRTATLTCDDGNGNIVFTKEIKHTDFPLDEITLYFTNNVIHLPASTDQRHARAGVLARRGFFLPVRENVFAEDISRNTPGKQSDVREEAVSESQQLSFTSISE